MPKDVPCPRLCAERDFEIAAAGAILRHPPLATECDPAWFGHPDIRRAVAAMGAAPEGARADAASLGLHLRAAGAITDVLLAEIEIEGGLPSQWEFLVGRVREAHQIRILDAALAGAREDLLDGAGHEEVAAAVASALAARGGSGAATMHASEACDGVMADIRLGWESPGGVVGLRTGFPKLDRATRGLQPGQLMVVGARPGRGKSSLALNIARAVTLGAEPAPVLFVSLEMPPRDLLARLVADLAGVPMGAAHSPVREKEIARALDLVRAAPLHFHCGGRSLRDIAGSIRAAAVRHGIRLAAVDYLQLVEPDKRTDNRANDLATVSGALKATAMESGVPVLALAQLNREAEGAEPSLRHLRESGAIEQDADAVLLLHRMKDDEEADVLPYSAILAKNRNGPTGRFPLQFRRTLCRFEQPYDDRTQ